MNEPESFSDASGSCDSEISGASNSFHISLDNSFASISAHFVVVCATDNGTKSGIAVRLQLSGFWASASAVSDSSQTNASASSSVQNPPNSGVTFPPLSNTAFANDQSFFVTNNWNVDVSQTSQTLSC